MLTGKNPAVVLLREEPDEEEEDEEENEQDKDKEEGMTTAIGVSTATGKEPTKVSYNGHAAANRPVKPPSVGHAPRQRAD